MQAAHDKSAEFPRIALLTVGEFALVAAAWVALSLHDALPDALSAKTRATTMFALVWAFGGAALVGGLGLLAHCTLQALRRRTLEAFVAAAVAASALFVAGVLLFLPWGHATAYFLREIFR
jgi:cytochrome bd-type quinol oxidase subunit 2